MNLKSSNPFMLELLQHLNSTHKKLPLFLYIECDWLYFRDIGFHFELPLFYSRIFLKSVLKTTLKLEIIM